MVDVDTPKPRLHYVSEGYLHYSEGTAGDGNIYVDDDGYNVKLDKLGRRYRVRSDGVREVPTSRPLGIPPEAWACMSEREKEEAIRTRDAVEKKSRAKVSAKAKPKTQDESEAAGVGGSIESEENEFEGYVPDFESSGFPLDPEADEVERFARERGIESDTESEAEPAAPGIEVEIERDNEYEFCYDGFEVPGWEEIASEGMKVESVPRVPIFDTGERHAKDLFQKGMISRKDVMSTLKLASLKTRINYRTIDVSGQSAPKKLDTWVFGLYNRGGVVGITNDTKRRPWLSRLVTAMIRAERPGFEFSAFSVNQNLEIGMHRGTTNLKGSLNAVIGLNKFSGGQLWVEDPKGKIEKAIPIDKLTKDGPLRCLEDMLRLPRGQ